MSFYIRITDGVPVDHPISEENMISAFPGIDLQNLSGDFAVYVQEEYDANIHPSIQNIFQTTYEDYVWDGDVVKRVWNVRDLNDFERSLIIAEKTKVINGYINLYRDFANRQLELTTDSEKRTFWENYKQTLDNFTPAADLSSYTIEQYKNYSFIPDFIQLDPTGQYLTQETTE